MFTKLTQVNKQVNIVAKSPLDPPMGISISSSEKYKSKT